METDANLESGIRSACHPNPSAAAIFRAFLRLGATAFGGPAMVVYIRDLAIREKGWIDEESFRDGVALCQSLPGATAMQTAAYVGLRARGFRGALAAYVGFGLPAFLIMVVLSALYREVHGFRVVTSVFQGLQVIVVALVANAAWSFGRSSVKGWQDALLAIAAGAYLISGGSPFFSVVGAAACGSLLYPKAPGGVSQPAAVGVTSRRRWLGIGVVVVATVAGLAGLFCIDRGLFGMASLMMKVDLFAFGGGFASLPLLFYEVVEVRGWLDAKTFMDGVALGQLTPGPIVITAAFVGYHAAGLAGALVATVAIFTPSLIVLTATVPYLDRLRHSEVFRKTLRGVLASFVGLLLAILLRFGMGVTWSTASVVIGALAFLALRLRVDILWVVFGGIFASAVLL